MCRIAYRHMQLIRGYHFSGGYRYSHQYWCPVTVTFYSVSRLGGVLKPRDYTRGRQEEDHNNENGDYRPSQLHLGASVNLCGLAPVIASFVS